MNTRMGYTTRDRPATGTGTQNQTARETLHKQTKPKETTQGRGESNQLDHNTVKDDGSRPVKRTAGHKTPDQRHKINPQLTQGRLLRPPSLRWPPALLRSTSSPNPRAYAEGPRSPETWKKKAFLRFQMRRPPRRHLAVKTPAGKRKRKTKNQPRDFSQATPDSCTFGVDDAPPPESRTNLPPRTYLCDSAGKAVPKTTFSAPAVWRTFWCIIYLLDHGSLLTAASKQLIALSHLRVRATVPRLAFAERRATVSQSECVSWSSWSLSSSSNGWRYSTHPTLCSRKTCAIPKASSRF